MIFKEDNTEFHLDVDDDKNKSEVKHLDYEATEVFTSSDPDFWDYIRLKDFTKKTGIDEKDCHAFAIKELYDNSADFIEKHRYSNATIVLNVQWRDSCSERLVSMMIIRTTKSRKSRNTALSKSCGLAQ